MCGIAGLIHKGKSSNIGGEMTSMLSALKHRGPDSTGFAVYGVESEGDYVMRFILAEQEAMSKGYDMKDIVAARLAKVEERLGMHKATIKSRKAVTDYAQRYVIRHDGDTEEMASIISEWSIG